MNYIPSMQQIEIFLPPLNRLKTDLDHYSSQHDLDKLKFDSFLLILIFHNSLKVTEVSWGLR